MVPPLQLGLGINLATNPSRGHAGGGGGGGGDRWWDYGDVNKIYYGYDFRGIEGGSVMVNGSNNTGVYSVTDLSGNENHMSASDPQSPQVEVTLAKAYMALSMNFSSFMSSK